MKALLSTAYWPNIQYMSKLISPEGACIEAHENYIKQSYRNRCHVMSPAGMQALSIPIEKYQDLKCPIKDIRISEHGRWRHFQTQALITNYASSPFFEYYFDDLETFFTQKRTFLWDLNLEIIYKVAELTRMELNISFTDAYVEEYPLDYRNSINPKKQLPDPYFKEQKYFQLFKEQYGFMPNLSILDLLFNEGPLCPVILQACQQYPNDRKGTESKK